MRKFISDLRGLLSLYQAEFIPTVKDWWGRICALSSSLGIIIPAILYIATPKGGAAMMHLVWQIPLVFFVCFVIITLFLIPYRELLRHTVKTAQTEQEHQSTIDELKKEHSKKLSEDNAHHEAQISSLEARIKELTEHKLVFEIETQNLSYVNACPDDDDNGIYSIKPRLYIRFENRDTNSLTVKSVNVLIIRKNEDGTELEISPTDQKLYEVAFNGEFTLSRTEHSWHYINLPIRGRDLTLYHVIEGYINVSAEQFSTLNSDCFLRATMEAMSQPPYSLDFDVNWQDALTTNAGLTPRT